VVATAIGLNPVNPFDKHRVLAVTHSNGAADVLLEALLKVGVPAVRIGRPASVSPNVQHRTAAAMAETHPEVVALRRAASDMKLQPYERAVAARQMQQCLLDVQKIIVNSAPVVVASCIGAHQLLMADDSEQVQFSTVVLDEAAQTTEPALICALAAAKAKQVVLVGDTHQLPPTVTSIHLRDTLGVSPMARLEGLGLPVRTLEVQYRLPKILLQHPSAYFYNGLIKSSDTVFQGRPPKGFAWPNDQPLAFVHVGSNLECTHDFGGKSNPTEANVVVDLVVAILAGGDIAAENMAIISPYAKQVQLLRSTLSTRRGAEEVRVGTVDSFQGQETDVVIFSSVRSNNMFELGFLRDPRRLCVAITRARRGLILVGDQPVLRACHHWAALLSYCSSNGCLVNAASLMMAAPPPTPSSVRPKSPMMGSTSVLHSGNFTFNDILADLMGGDPEEVGFALFDDDDDLTDLSE
jgi:ATP-dependent RNA/DNA helicase IGHMBP2